MRVRAHVRLVAAAWLTCQVAAFAASPFVLCHDHAVMAQTTADHECGPTHHHGQPPSTTASHEHHHHSTEASAPESNGASVSCRCTISDAALAALTLDAGILPGVFALGEGIASVRVVLTDYVAPTHSQNPDSPPPRA